MDQISHLPEHIQHRILDLLELEEVGRAAVLSQTWRSIVRSHPVLCFTQSLFNQTCINILGEINLQPLIAHRSFSNLIDELIRKKSVINKFNLSLFCGNRHSHWQSHLDSWIQHLAKVGGVKELILHLSIGSEPGSPLYILPPPALCSKTLTKLILSSSFNIDAKQCTSVSLPNLLELELGISERNEEMFNMFISSCPKLLKLNLTMVNFNPEMFKSFVSGCPNLFELTLTTSDLNQHVCKNVMPGCPNLEILDIHLEKDGVSSICVSGLPRLRIVHLEGVSRAKIVAPRLEVFTFCPCVNTTAEIDLSACETTLKVLWLFGLKVSKETLRSHISKFLELEELVLEWIHVESIEIPNNKIRKLAIEECHALEKLEIGASNPEIFTFTRDNFLNKFPNWINTFKEYFLNFGRFKDIKLMLRYAGNLIICEALDENFIKMLHETKKMRPVLKIMRAGSYESLLDTICRGPEYLSKIDYISMLSRDHQSGELFLQVLNHMTVEENVEPNWQRYCNKINGKRVLYHVVLNRVLHHAELITTEIPNHLKAYDTVEYEITRVKLHWIQASRKRARDEYTYRKRQRDEFICRRWRWD